MGLLLASSTSIAIQGSAVVLYEESLTELEGCCCGGCTCADVGAAVIGADFEVELLSFADGECDDCATTLNDVFTFLDVPTEPGICGTQVDEVIDADCTQYAVQLTIDESPVSGQGIRVLAVSDNDLTFKTFFNFQLDDVCSVLDELIAGDWIDIPLESITPNGGDNDACDITATPTCRIRRIAPP